MVLLKSSQNAKLEACLFIKQLLLLLTFLRGVVQKNGLFTVRLTVSPVGPEHKQMSKYLPIFTLKFYSLILKTHFISM